MKEMEGNMNLTNCNIYIGNQTDIVGCILMNIFAWSFPLICLQGVIANACSFYVIVTNRRLFSYVSRQYFCIISMTDILILIVNGSMFYSRTIGWTKEWMEPPADCSVFCCILFGFFSYYAAVGAPFFQLGLTVDRLVAVASPLKAKMILSRRRSWILLAVIAAMSLILPTMFVSNLGWDAKAMKCSIKDLNEFVITYPKFELYFGRVFLMSSLILGTIAICLLLAWNNRTARRMQMETASVTEPLRQNSSRERQRSLVRMSLMLVYINLLFLVTHLPHSITLSSGIKRKDCSYIYQLFLHALEFLNNAVSWPAFFLGGNFRRVFYRIFMPLCLSTAPSRLLAQ